MSDPIVEAQDTALAAPKQRSHLQVLQVGDKTLHVLGTAHISARSEQEVDELIRELRPDTVCVELCQSRYDALINPAKWREMDIVQVIRQKRATMLLAHLILSAFQRKLGDRVGIKPGAEMLRAIDVAKETGAELVLADRNIQVTLMRTWRNLSWWDRLKLFGNMTLSLAMQSELDEEEIESLKRDDMLTQVMNAFAQAFPRAKATLIDERDAYLAHRIRHAPGRTVVAVVGAGHLKGLMAHLQAPAAESVTALESIPPRGLLSRLLPWLIPLLVLGLIGYGFFSANAAVSWEMVKVWVLANGILAALGALLALAHPLTIVTAFVAAPLTSLNPMVAAGWVAGLCEALLRRPRVADFERLPADIVSVRGFWRNGITRILLVVALANVGSSIGTFVGIPLMTRLLG